MLINQKGLQCMLDYGQGFDLLLRVKITQVFLSVFSRRAQLRLDPRYLARMQNFMVLGLTVQAAGWGNRRTN